MNDLYLTDEDIHALDEPTWEEQEIKKLKKKIEQLDRINNELGKEEK